MDEKRNDALVDDVTKLKSLGSNTTEYTYDSPNVGILETFPNKYPDRRYVVDLKTDEFTSLCGKTGQPDFGQISISYIPDELCIETKSLKLYLFAFRNAKIFMESLTNKILEDLVDACDPIFMRVTGEFASRGGIGLSCVAEYEKDEDTRRKGKSAK